MADRRVLDTSALMSGRAFEGELFTTDDVLRELRRQGALTPQLEAVLAVKVRAATPSRESLAAVSAAAEETGDAHRLSPADAGLLAVARDLGATVVTDDYSIQNVADRMGIPYEGVAERGIRAQWRWRYRCTGCRKAFEAWHDACPVCGAPLRTARRR